tara:strand:- start:22756 stop:23019 length:264 start_codon:yes stop_codon:yes gene_type:complete
MKTSWRPSLEDLESTADEELSKHYSVQGMPTDQQLFASTFRRDVFSLPEGKVVLQWPEVLSPESFNDVRDWLSVVMRKIERATKKTV